MKYSVDIEELRRLYIGRGLTSRQIGQQMGIPYKTILRYLKAAGVNLRNPGSPIIDQLADRVWLVRRYVQERKSTTQIAEEIGCSAHSVSLWLHRHGVEARPPGSEKSHSRHTEKSRQQLSKARRGRFTGSENSNWRGGVQLKHPERNRYKAKMWVKAVKDRDEWRCVECDATDRLHAHHIKRWRDYPDLRYEISNGITLCYSCHEAAHGRGFKFRWPKHAEIPKSASAH